MFTLVNLATEGYARWALLSNAIAQDQACYFQWTRISALF